MAQHPHDPFSPHDAVPDEPEDAPPVEVPDDAELAEMRKADLADLAGRLNLATSGNRDELIARIVAHRGD
jgi:hypothetical protein